MFWFWVIYLGLGALAGWLAGRVMNSQPFGLFGNIFFGILGGIVGGWVMGAFGVGASSIIGSFAIAFLGALLILWVIKLFKRV